MTALTARTELTRLRDRFAFGPSTAPFHVETPEVQRRRRIIVAVAALAGALFTALALNRHDSDLLFFVYSFALAGVWIVAALISGPLHLGRWNGRRDLLRPIVLGTLAFLLFLAGDLIFRQVPYLHRRIDDIIGLAGGDTLVLTVIVAVINGIGEEMFFRGAMYSAFGRRRPLVGATVVYIAVISCSRNPLLVLAGLIMGVLFALERRATRGILASSITHVTWSLLMIGLLPR